MEEAVQVLRETKTFTVDGKRMTEEEFKAYSSRKDIRLHEEGNDSFRTLHKLNG